MASRQQTEKTSLHRAKPVASAGLSFSNLRGILAALGLVLLLSLLVGSMAYQAPPAGRVSVGWLGDRLFLGSTAGLGADAETRGDFYADDLTPGAPMGRSRWTRQHARITLPNLGAGADLTLHLAAQGWPTDVVGAPVAQPTITVHANGTPVGQFQPRATWATYDFRVPADARTDGDLVVDLYSSHTFTDTLSFGADPRPKGVRLAELRVAAAVDDPTLVYPPAWRAVGLLAACALLLYALLARILRITPIIFAATIVGVSVAGLGLATARIWMGVALGVALLVLPILLVLAWHRELLSLTRAMVRRYTLGNALSYGLVAAALVLLGYALAGLFSWMGTSGRPLFWQIFPDSLLYGLLAAGLIALGLVLGRDGLPHLADSTVAAIGSRRGSLLLLAGFGLTWLGYQAWVIATLPYVGHADYSDNAVVARNLVTGRGWVVDYVSQFYQLIDGTTRPQETWPLLQPVWIAPFFALFGPSNWAAKLPNLFFNLILLVMVYQIGTRIWDRRVGVTAAVFTLTNYLFFRLTIYVTSDLAFVVFSVGAIYCLYRASSLDHEDRERLSEPHEREAVKSVTNAHVKLQTGGRGSPRPVRVRIGTGVRPRSLRYGFLLLSGALTGLMMLQKPSGAMIALGMGLWLVGMQNAACRMQKYSLQSLLRSMSRVAAWSLLALTILSPYLVRNMVLFERPVYSTESKDAWVLGYLGNSGDAWEEIYRVFTPELGGPGNPDRSWILRWGFDKTLAKFATQARELRDYLMPVWNGLPDAVGWLFGRNEAKNINSGLGAWLALIGVIGALRFRRRLLGLLAMAYTPYIVFMLTYWRTDEHRYWVILIPWLALLAAWTIWAGYDKLAKLGDRRWAPLGLILAIVAISGVVSFSRPDIANKIRNEPEVWAPDLAAYRWLQANTTPGAVVMTRIPWQLNWHTERPAVMIPNTADRALLLTIARHYDAKYLVLENQQRVKGDAGDLLAPLMDQRNQVSQVIDGFELIYASPTPDFRAFVYRIPAE